MSNYGQRVYQFPKLLAGVQIYSEIVKLRRNDRAVYRVGGSVVEFSPATRETVFRFPANAEYFTSRMIFNEFSEKLPSSSTWTEIGVPPTHF